MGINSRFKKLMLFLVVLLWIFSTRTQGQITLPSIFSDGMVMQQKSDVPVWGWANPGEFVSVTGSWDDKVVSTISGLDGKWQVTLKTPKAGGPFSIIVQGSERKDIKDVLMGEVWLASGQSNMEMPVRGFLNEPILHFEETVKNARYPNIRFFNVQKLIALEQQKDAQGEWIATSPETVQDFSATAYFFALQLFEKLNVPVGIIASNWGGTVAEAWVSEGSLRELGDFDNQLDKYRNILENYEETQKKDEEQTKKWEIREKEVWKNLAMPDYDDSDWKMIKVPALWENEGYPKLDGIAWYRTEIDIPSIWDGKELVLNLGLVNDNDMTWFNGHKIGETDGAVDNRRYSIPGQFVKSGKNILAVRVVDIGRSGGIYGSAKNIKLFPKLNETGDTLPLAGDWKFKPVADKPVLINPESPSSPSVLYNGMIAPLVPYAIKGAIWYQGESNVGRAKQYETLFPMLIQDWREKWSVGKFPFYFVQIAPFPYGGDAHSGAALRDAQRRSLHVKNTGMAVIMDINDTTTIHPPDKKGVGNRLSVLALSRTYGKKRIVDSGPLFQKMKVRKGVAIVSFTHVGKGLVAKDGQLNGFEIAGKDGRYVPAKAMIKGRRVIIQADEISYPAAVRYAWKDTAEPWLFNKEGLPASTFATDYY